jgi:hypothetical protein
MEIRKKYIIALVMVIMLLTGCGKSYTDYPDIWISNEYNIQINPKQETAIIDNPEIDKDKIINILSNGKKRELYFCYGNEMGDGDPTKSIWKAYAKVKDDKLYLEIVSDKVTNLEGKTIILKQKKE